MAKKREEQFTPDELREGAALVDAPAPATPPPDEHAGKGGSFVVDPVTGKRIRVEYTLMPHEDGHPDKKG